MNNFNQCYEYSLGARERFDTSLLSKFIPNFKSVIKTDSETDKKGIDYIATLRDGSTITIDAKTRVKGSSKYWKNNEPELALEQWSVVEQKKVGWVFKDSDQHPNYILYTFDRSDTDKFYFIPYLLLRKAAYRNWKQWEKMYGIKYQPNNSHGGYTSSAIFIPANTLISAVSNEMISAV